MNNKTILYTALIASALIVWTALYSNNQSSKNDKTTNTYTGQSVQIDEKGGASSSYLDTISLADYDEAKVLDGEDSKQWVEENYYDVFLYQDGGQVFNYKKYAYLTKLSKVDLNNLALQGDIPAIIYTSSYESESDPIESFARLRNLYDNEQAVVAISELLEVTERIIYELSEDRTNRDVTLSSYEGVVFYAINELEKQGLYDADKSEVENSLEYFKQQNYFWRELGKNTQDPLTLAKTFKAKDGQELSTTQKQFVSKVLTRIGYGDPFKEKAVVNTLNNSFDEIGIEVEEGY